MIRLEMSEGASSKFWEIELKGKSFTARWGRIGTTGREKTQSWRSPAAAQKEHDKLVASKRKKGYAEAAKSGKSGKAPKVAPAVSHPRNPALEAAIRSNREDPSAYAVYADWLQSNGSALGELIILEQALAKAARKGKAKKPDPEKRKRAAAIKKTLALPSKDLAEIGWREGMWRWLKLDTKPNADLSDLDALEVARPLFASPLCSALEELRLGTLRWKLNHKDVPAVLLEAGKQAWSRDLARLHLGGRDEVLNTPAIGDVGKVITKSFPNLTCLELVSGELFGRETFGIGPLALPELVTLIVKSCSLSKKQLKQVLEAKLPRLETLELWFGDGATAKLKDLSPLLDGTVHPKVVHLGLCHTSFTDQLVRALPTSKIAARLESLDLWMGALSDEGAIALAAGAKAFPRLKTLSFHFNFLDRATIRGGKAAFKGVSVADNVMALPSRGVSLSE